jgi:hypothetical protein
MRASILVLTALLAASASGQTSAPAIRSYHDWKRMRTLARTGADFRALQQWCVSQVEIYRRKAADYQTELREYQANLSSRALPKQPPYDQDLKSLIAHYQDLAKHWHDLAAAMAGKAGELDAAGVK